MGNTASEVEFQEVKLRLPKSVIDYVYKMYGDPKRWLEYYVVDWIRIDVETKDPEEPIVLFNLEAAFHSILGE
jgi:hypothetical protein